VSVLLVEQNARAALQVADRAYVLEMGAVAERRRRRAAARPPRSSTPTWAWAASTRSLARGRPAAGPRHLFFREIFHHDSAKLHRRRWIGQQAASALHSAVNGPSWPTPMPRRSTLARRSTTRAARACGPDGARLPGARALKALAKYLNEHKESLYAISAHTGATRADSWIDIEGGTGTLFAYASMGSGELPSGNLIHEGPACRWARRAASPAATSWCRAAAWRCTSMPSTSPSGAAGEVRAQLPGRHALHRQAGHRHQLPDRGGGAPDRAVGPLPAGALQLVIGGTGDLLDRLKGRTW
jgi:oxepin-CoA hydrolase/3-oxo-5,6-dehydrosuberyl-CoA semialdehyde dehydrogenase